jgi:hypothetical protein
MRRSMIVCGLLLALAGIPSAVAAAAGGNVHQAEAAGRESRTQAYVQSIAYWDDKAQRAQAATARWLTVVHGHPPRHASRTHASSTPQAARHLAQVWHQRAIAALDVAKHPPKLRAWYCIHHYEGSWTDPNAPYWGGLQMDYEFQSAYGAWLLKHEGTADNWTPLEQIWTGVRAWRVRGFEPWSSSAHACGVY